MSLVGISLGGISQEGISLGEYLWWSLGEYLWGNIFGSLWGNISGGNVSGGKSHGFVDTYLLVCFHTLCNLD